MTVRPGGSATSKTPLYRGSLAGARGCSARLSTRYWETGYGTGIFVDRNANLALSGSEESGRAVHGGRAGAQRISEEVDVGRDWCCPAGKALWRTPRGGPNLRYAEGIANRAHPFLLRNDMNFKSWVRIIFGAETVGLSGHIRGQNKREKKAGTDPRAIPKQNQ